VEGLAGELELRALALDRVADRPGELAGVDAALGQVVLGTELHGLDGASLVVVGGDHDDRQVGRSVADRHHAVAGRAMADQPSGADLLLPPLVQ